MDADWLATKARKQPTLAEALDAIEAAVSPSAAATARMLYDLGTALNKGKARIQEGRVASAMAKLTALMLEEHKESGSSSNAPRIQQLQGGREFNLSAWALSKVQTIRDTDVTQLGLAFTEQALHGPVMNGEGWRGWSALLFGLAKAGMSCQSNLQVQRLFTKAVTQRLPELLMQGQDCNAQDLSNTLLACVQAGYTKGDLQVLVSALASPAGVRILQTDDATPQEISNTVWALAVLKFYDFELYSVASRALLEKFERCSGHNLSNRFYSCAEAQHWDSSMDGLAELISEQTVQQRGHWKAQAIANTLYSWAVLTVVGAAPASPGFNNMAQQLFTQASILGLSCCNDLDLVQIALAHKVAVHIGLAGGDVSPNKELSAAVGAAYLSSVRRLQKRAEEWPLRMDAEVAAALQRAGYQVERAAVVGSTFVKMQAQGVAVTVAHADDYFHAPLSLLKGSIAVHGVLASWVCKGNVVISEAEWASLKGDPQRQQALVAQRLHQALSRV